MPKFFRVFIPLFLLLSAASQAQDTLHAAVPDTLKAPVDTFYTKHRANRAAVYSAVLPGLGQAYNKKYWKIPILYSGFVALGYFIEYNNRYYKIFRKAYRYRVDGDSSTVDDYVRQYPDANSLLVARDYYRRTRDLMWIISSGVYVLNIIDAYVDAHLSDFDVSDNLSISTQPVFRFTGNGEAVPALSVCLSFR